MSRQRSLLIVEGPHDCAVLGRLLRPLGLKLLQKEERVDPFWSPTIPRQFPVGGDLLARPPVPSFFQSDAHSVAVQVAGGDSGLAKRLALTLKTLPGWQKELGAVAICLDADEKTPEDRWRGLRSAAAAQSLPLSLAERPGQIEAGPPRVGGYVFPDNLSPGTLEDLLLSAGEVAYPTLLGSARDYVDRIDQGALTRADLEEFSKNAGKKKATLGAIASVLRPGKAVQNTIQDNRWLEGPSLDVPAIAHLRRFLHAVLDIPLE